MKKNFFLLKFCARSLVCDFFSDKPFTWTSLLRQRNSNVPPTLVLTKTPTLPLKTKNVGTHPASTKRTLPFFCPCEALSVRACVTLLQSISRPPRSTTSQILSAHDQILLEHFFYILTFLSNLSQSRFAEPRPVKITVFALFFLLPVKLKV